MLLSTFSKGCGLETIYLVTVLQFCYLGLCRFCVGNLSCCEFMIVIFMSCPGDRVSRHSSPSSGSDILSTSSSKIFLESWWWWDQYRGFPLGLNVQYLVLSTLTSCESLQMTAVHYKRKLLDTGWEQYMSVVWIEISKRQQDGRVSSRTVYVS